MSKKANEAANNGKPAENEPDEATKAAEAAAAAAITETKTPKTYTEAEFNAALAKAQKETDKKVADAEKKSKLAEDERTKVERDEALAALKERDTRDAVIEQAGEAGIKNPRLFYNAYKSEIEVDDKGKITNLKDVLESAKTESPELFTAAPQPEGSADGGEGKTNTGALTKDMIDKMSDAEIAANMDKIDAFLSSSVK